MKTANCQAPVSCCNTVAVLGGVAGSDFAALDALAVKLICLDSAFTAPLWQMGRLLGERIASDREAPLVSLDAALSALIPACGLDGVVSSHFSARSAEGARLQIAGCAEALSWPVPQVGRTVCSFDAGLFEGFLCAATGETWSVEETACLGLGNPACEFIIHRATALGGDEYKGMPHGRS